MDTGFARIGAANEGVLGVVTIVTGFARIGVANEGVLGVATMGILERTEACFVEGVETPTRGLPSNLRVKHSKFCKEALERP